MSRAAAAELHTPHAPHRQDELRRLGIAFEGELNGMADGWASNEATRRRWRYLAALGIVLASTLVAEVLYRLLGTNRLSTIFLAGVLITAVSFGSGPAYFAAVLAFAVYNVYLSEPRFTLTFGSEDVLLLLIFLAVAMLTGRLAGQVRDQARLAQARARTAGALFDATRSFSALHDEAVIRQELVRHVSQAARGEALLLHDDEPVSWPEALQAPAEVIAAVQAEQRGEGASQLEGWRVHPLVSQGERLGALAWRQTHSDGPIAQDDPLIEVLIEVGAAAIIRARLAAAQAEVRAFAQTERLRNALLSSISHDLRTPLASILASVSSLREFGERFDPSVRADLLSTIEEEGERLNRFVANLLQMTKLEGGALGVECGRVDLREVAQRVIHRVKARAGKRRLLLRGDGERVEAHADPILLEQALSNVVENALRFSPDGSAITITAARRDARVLVEVTDEGPGVPASDLCRIFEKFYRSPTSAANLQGTGLGLSIVKGLVEAMGGDVSARAGGTPKGGLTVSLQLPAAAAG